MGDAHALVDVETLDITGIHSTTSKKFGFRIGPQVARASVGDLRSLAAARGYDAKAFRDEFRANGIRSLIKHRIYSSLDYAHNARMDSDHYHQRSMSETVFSNIKRTLGTAVRARTSGWSFREIVLKTAVYNLHPSVRFL